MCRVIAFRGDAAARLCVGFLVWRAHLVLRLGRAARRRAHVQNAQRAVGVLGARRLALALEGRRRARVRDARRAMAATARDWRIALLLICERPVLASAL